jgi:hypothetical protein
LTRQDVVPDTVAPALGETMETLGAAFAAPAKRSATARAQRKRTGLLGLALLVGRERFETARSA